MTQADIELDRLMSEILASVEKMGVEHELPLKDLCPIGWEAVHDKPGVGKAMKARVDGRQVNGLVVVRVEYGNSGRKHTAYRRND